MRAIGDGACMTIGVPASPPQHPLVNVSWTNHTRSRLTRTRAVHPRGERVAKVTEPSDPAISM